MNRKYFAAFSAAVFGLLLPTAYGCAPAKPEGPTVRIFTDGKTRTVPAADVNDADLIRRGYIRTSDAGGSILYVRIPKTDVVEVHEKGGNDDRKRRRGGRLKTGRK